MKRTGTLVVALALALAATSCAHLLSRGLGVPLIVKGRPRAQMNVMVPMRDGVRLATDLYLPPGPGPFPVVLTRLPYGTDVFMFKELGKFMAREGYVFAAQDTRGTFSSEGAYFPLIFDYDDGHDTIAWVLKQPWCNGKVGMWGGSYFAFTQWESAPDNPALAAITPLYGSGNMHKVIYRGGATEFVSWTGWNAQMAQQQAERAGRHTDIKADFSQGYYNEPLRDAQPVDMEAAKKDPVLLQKGVDPWMHHPGDIINASCLNYEPWYSHTSAPAYMVGGWYDLFLSAQLEDFVRLRAEGQGNARQSRLIIGPWIHGMPSSKFEDSRFTGPRLFGQGFIGWFNTWLKGEKPEAAAPLKIFVLGENKWRDEWEWPLKRTVFTDYYLHSGGRANSSAGDGSLSTEKPAGEPGDRFDYDPRNPVPTAGGSFLGQKTVKAGAKEQREIEKRKDVLLYATPSLTQPVEVTGPIQLTLFAASSAKDTDWTAKLVDIFPNGHVQNLQDGIVRARYRDGYAKPSLLEPGKVYAYTVDLWATANVFLPGHRIGLEISSSNFPQFDRNTNAGGEGGPGNVVTAQQTIFHRADYPSHLTLPVIPR